MHGIHLKKCETVASTLPEKFELKKNHHQNTTTTTKNQKNKGKKKPHGFNKVIFARVLSTLGMVPTFVS